MDILKAQDIIDETFELTTDIEGRKFNAKSLNEFNCLWISCSGRSFKNFVVVSPPYTMLMICNGDQLILLDTHPVPPSLGGRRSLKTFVVESPLYTILILTWVYLGVESRDWKLKAYLSLFTTPSHLMYGSYFSG